MRTKFITTLITLIAMLAFAASPAHAQETDTDNNAPDVEDIDNDDSREDDSDDGLGPVRSAAARAKAAASSLENGEADPELTTALEQAKEALTAARDRITADSAGNSGMAAQVLTALIAGDSPKEIGAEHGEAIAQAAAQRRSERAETDNGRPETTGRPDDAGRPEGVDLPEQADISQEDHVPDGVDVPEEADASEGAGRP
jgi:hypothetical protein